MKLNLSPLLLICASISAQEYNDVMIVGGRHEYTLLDDVEIINLNNETSPCGKPPNFPIQADGMVGTLISGSPTLCGGYTSTGEYTADCVSYTFSTGLWEPSESMLTERGFASGVMLNETHWWITGGYNGTDLLKTTELFNVETWTFSPYVDLPRRTDSHVLLKIDDTRFYLCCGRDMEDVVYFFNLDTERWIPNFGIYNRAFSEVQ